MSTFLFDHVIFGPVKSRRLGSSLGINLLPSDSKWCSFNCIYCECGWTGRPPFPAEDYPSRERISRELEKRLLLMLQQDKLPDTITFAGNGEPTMHPDFGHIISDTLRLRDHYAPEAKIAVLSNGTMLDEPSVFLALEKVDQNILKIDSAREETLRILNQPGDGFRMDQLLDNIRKFGGNFVLQSMFIKGMIGDRKIDNTSAGELDDWLKLVKDLNPEMVMVYTIARDTPLAGLRRIPATKLHDIAARVEKLGIPVQVSS